MRRIVKIIAYIALVVLMQDSCQKKDNLSKAYDSKKEEIEVQREVSVTSFYAYSGENDSKTKTSRKENGDLWWSPGDEIMVFCGEASGKFVSQNKESAEIATFVGLFDKEVSTAEVYANGVLAFYPYSEELTREGDAVVFTLPSSQLAVAGTFDDDLYPVIARSDTTELSFYNICGGAKFTVSKEGIKTVTIRGNDSEPLAGKLSVTLDENGIPIVEVVDGETEIVVTAPDGGTFEVGKEYYIVTIPQYLTKGFTLIYNKGLSIYNEFKTTKSINIKRSKFGVLEFLDKNLDIADWDDPIEFVDRDVEEICVTEWDTNWDGKLSYKEAALVQTIGIVFQSESIHRFDELKYFTGLTSIDSDAFYECNYLWSVTIPSSVTSIGSSAFYNCRSLLSVTIPSSVTSIGDKTFYECDHLQSVTIPSSVTSIGDKAFYECDHLQSVTIPSSVTSIGNDAFYGCRGDLYVNCNIPSYSSYDATPFYRSKFTSIVIGEGVASIGDYAFYDCSDLLSVTIPSSVTSIGDKAFYNCRYLQSVTIPSSVTSIGSSSFYNCHSLQSVTIPSSVTSIGNDAFYGCPGDLYVNCNIPSYSSYDASPFHMSEFTSLVIGEGVASIGDYAFYQCSRLRSVTIPSSVTSIGSRAFQNCSSLRSVTIPSSVTSIGSNAFYNCHSLQSVIIPSSVTSIGSNAFNGCGGDLYVNCNIPSYSSLDANPFYRSKFTNLVIGEGVASIGDYAFYDCSGLQSVTIPSSVTSIGYRAFYNCGGDLYVNCNIPSYSSLDANPFYRSKFTSLVIGEGVTSIGDNAFYGSSGLQSVTIPSSVTSIGNNAFYNCYGDLYVNCNIPSYSSYDANPFFKCDFTSLVIGEGVASIGDYAFCNCSSCLQSVTIPSSVTSIGSNAFYGCGGDLYVNCNIPSYSYYDASPFHMSEFTSLVIGEGVASIGDYAFYGCSGLQSVTISEGVTLIGYSAFRYCRELSTVYCYPKTPPGIGLYAFDGCSLDNIYVPYSSANAYREKWSAYNTIITGKNFLD